MHPDITAELIAEKLDKRSASEVSANHIKLENEYRLDRLIEAYVEAFPSIRNSPGRIEIMFWVQRYARVNPRVVELARYALGDKSKIVRNYACGALAYAVDHNSLSALSNLLKHENHETREDAQAAIKAIEKKNHNLFADREETGNIFWSPGKID